MWTDYIEPFLMVLAAFIGAIFGNSDKAKDLPDRLKEWWDKRRREK